MLWPNDNVVLDCSSNTVRSYEVLTCFLREYIHPSELSSYSKNIWGSPPNKDIVTFRKIYFKRIMDLYVITWVVENFWNIHSKIIPWGKQNNNGKILNIWEQECLDSYMRINFVKIVNECCNFNECFPYQFSKIGKLTKNSPMKITNWNEIREERRNVYETGMFSG